MQKNTNDQIILDRILDDQKAQVASDLSGDAFFEIFTSEQILKDFDLAYDEILDGIVDGGGDGGVDAVYAFMNGILVQEDSDLSARRGETMIDLFVIQAKCTDGFSANAVDKLRITTRDLLNLSNDLAEFETTYSAKLLAIMSRFRSLYAKNVARFPILRISYYFATKGDSSAIHPTVQKKADEFKLEVNGLYSTAEVSFRFLGARDLILLAQRSPYTTKTIQLAENPISTGSEAFICLVSLDDFHSFLTDEDGKLQKGVFEANVRDYAGDVSVNQAIRETLEKPAGEDFWWLNNGVTIVSTKASLSAKTLTLENPQIVNGLQTSTEIHSYYQSQNTDQEERNILLRAIVTSDSKGRDRIIRATNRQTSIPDASLRSTDQIHRDIESYLNAHGLYYDRRKNYYKNLRKPLNKIISIPYMAQAVMAIVLQKPDQARARPSTLLKQDSDYILVFSPSYPIALYLRCIEVMKRVEAFIRDHESNPCARDINNIKFHVAMYSVVKATNGAIPAPTHIAQFNVSSLTDKLLDDCLKTVTGIYKSLGEDDQVAKGVAFVEQLSALS